MRRAALVFAAACSATPRPHGPATGSIVGVTWDRETGNALDHVDITANRASATSDAGGLFELGNLAPGHYKIHATHDTRSVALEVDIAAGDAVFVKLPFSTATPDQQLTLDDPSAAEITRFRPPTLAANASQIEGFVIDTRTHGAVAGGVVTAVGPAGPNAALQTVSDEVGHFRFDAVQPGTYALSVYYSVGHRGQIEVRRSGIAVAPGEAVVVPLLLETVH